MGHNNGQELQMLLMMARRGSLIFASRTIRRFISHFYTAVTEPWGWTHGTDGIPYQWGGGTPKTNDSTALPYPFTSLYLRGRTNGFMMKGGNAAEGKLKTMWDGPRPDARTGPKGQQCSYQPMRKQGAIILGTGGDNSNRAEGRQNALRFQHCQD